MKVRRRHLVFTAKLAVGLALLAALLIRDDNWRTVGELAGQLRYVHLVSLAVVTFGLLWISCAKWRLFLRQEGDPPSILSLMRLYLVGLFFNNFFPGSFGGDVVRSYLLGRRIRSQGRALATVFLERLSGFVAMVSLAAAAFLLSPSLQEDAIVKWSIVIMMLATAGVGLVFIRPQILNAILTPFSSFGVVEKVLQKVGTFHAEIRHAYKRPRLIAHAMLYSYIFYVLAAIAVYVAGLVIGVQCDLSRLFAVTPIVMLLAAFPLTPNSIGIWEWGWSVYLVSAGATLEQGLAIALLLRVRDLFLALVGALFFIAGKQRRDRAEEYRGANSIIPISDEPLSATHGKVPHTTPKEGQV